MMTVIIPFFIIISVQETFLVTLKGFLCIAIFETR